MVQNELTLSHAARFHSSLLLLQGQQALIQRLTETSLQPRGALWGKRAGWRWALRRSCWQRQGEGAALVRPLTGSPHPATVGLGDRPDDSA